MQKQLEAFLEHVRKVCPWFPKEGILNETTWRQVGHELQQYYNNCGPAETLVDTFELW